MAMKQVPITEQKFVTLPTELEPSVEEVKTRIIDLFSQLDDDDVNVARKLWRELNGTLIQAFTLGVYDIACGECGSVWTVARRQALNELDDYRTKAKTCPECGSASLTLDFDFQLAIRETLLGQPSQAVANSVGRALRGGEAEAAAAAARP